MPRAAGRRPDGSVGRLGRICYTGRPGSFGSTLGATFMKVCVIGAGYVGLVTGTGFAETGNDVTCVDLDNSKVERLRRGEIPIFEPGLEPMVQRNLEIGTLKFSNEVEKGVA